MVAALKSLSENSKYLSFPYWDLLIVFFKVPFDILLVIGIMSDLVLKLGKFRYYVIETLDHVLAGFLRQYSGRRRGMLLPSYCQMEAEVHVHHLVSVNSCSRQNKPLLLLGGGLDYAESHDSPQNYFDTTPAGRKGCSLSQND